MAAPISTFGYILRGTTNSVDYVQNPMAESLNANGFNISNANIITAEELNAPNGGTLTVRANDVEIDGDLAQSGGSASLGATTITGALTQSGGSASLGATTITGALTQSGGSVSVNSTTALNGTTTVNGALITTAATSHTGATNGFTNGVIIGSGGHTRTLTVNGSDQLLVDGGQLWPLPSVNSSGAIQVFTASGTYTPTANMKFCIVELVGGGGGAGGASVNPGSAGYNGGGGGGAYIKTMFPAATIGASQAVVIGAGGAGGGSGAAGTDGGDSTFGALLTAIGGDASLGWGAGSTSPYAAGGGGGAAPSGSSTIVNIAGGSGDAGQDFYSSAMGGRGGASSIGLGGSPTYVDKSLVGNWFHGNVGVSYGGGGGGGCCWGNSPTTNGGAGIGGICIITEFI